jgi:hypothetical protein
MLRLVLSTTVTFGVGLALVASGRPAGYGWALMLIALGVLGGRLADRSAGGDKRRNGVRWRSQPR